MNLPLDTHYLLWVAGRKTIPSADADALIKDPANALWFSVASLWEVRRLVVYGGPVLSI